MADKDLIAALMRKHSFLGQEHKSRIEEAMIVKNMLEATPKLVKEGSQWFLLPQVWLKQWELYCFFDLLVNDPEDWSEARNEER